MTDKTDPVRGWEMASREIAQRIAELHPPVDGRWQADACPAWIEAIRAIVNAGVATAYAAGHAAGVAQERARWEQVVIDVANDERHTKGERMGARMVGAALRATTPTP